MMDAETRAALNAAMLACDKWAREIRAAGYTGERLSYEQAIPRLQALLDGEKGGDCPAQRERSESAERTGLPVTGAACTAPPDAKKGAATFKLGDNPNEYADDDDAKPSLAERIEVMRDCLAMSGDSEDDALYRECAAIAAELREIAEDIHGYRDTYTRGAYCLSDHKAKELADRLARRKP